MHTLDGSLLYKVVYVASTELLKVLRWALSVAVLLNILHGYNGCCRNGWPNGFVHVERKGALFHLTTPSSSSAFLLSNDADLIVIPAS